MLIRAIALQLVASCYTLLPASSSCNLPLLYQRTHSKPISALRLNSQYRFEPATGHHARMSSESASWPWLYAGPTLEDALAELTSRRRAHRRNRDYTPLFTASGWTDGNSSPQVTRRARGLLHSKKQSNPSFEPGFFSRLICQTSIPKIPARKHNTLFTNLASKRKKSIGLSDGYTSPSETGLNRPKLSRHVASQAVQRIPSSLRLRRTQSVPRITIDNTSPSGEPYTPRRHGSSPSIGSPLGYPYEIPGIRTASATPAASFSMGALSTLVRMCGRGDLITLQEYLDKSEVDESLLSTKRDGNALAPPVQISSAISPLGISPRNISTVAPIPLQQPTDYFASAHVATDVHDGESHDTDENVDLREEREDAGPSIYECPILQEIFAKMEAPDGEYSDDDYSSESDMRRTGKRKSLLVEAGSTDREMMEMFGSRRESR
jgi:hypothetical protein